LLLGTAEQIDRFKDGASFIRMVVHDWGPDDPFRLDGPRRGARFMGRDPTCWRYECICVFRHDFDRWGLTGWVRCINHEPSAVAWRERDMYAVFEVQRVYDGGTSLYSHQPQNLRSMPQLRVLDRPCRSPSVFSQGHR
jgi:hypothetical protein